MRTMIEDKNKIYNTDGIFYIFTSYYSHHYVKYIVFIIILWYKIRGCLVLLINEIAVRQFFYASYL